MATTALQPGDRDPAGARQEHGSEGPAQTCGEESP